MGTIDIHDNSKIIPVGLINTTSIHGILYSSSRIFISGISIYYITLISVLLYLISISHHQEIHFALMV